MGRLWTMAQVNRSALPEVGLLQTGKFDPIAVVEQCRTKSYKRKDGVLDIVGLADTAQRKRPG